MQHFNEIKSLLGQSDTYYLIAVDMNSNYSYLNKRYAQVFEPIHGNLVGRHYAMTIHPDDQRICSAVSEMAFNESDAVFPATLRKMDGSGGFIVTRWDYKAMFDEDGSPAGIFCIGHDITALLQMSGELKDMKNSHSHSVRKHVANLTGLGKLVQQAMTLSEMQDASNMIVESAAELDKVIKEIYN